MDVAVFDLNGQKADTLVLDDARWASPANLRLLNQAIRMYRSNQRAGTASTKTRGDVSGGGKKPWKQKHTGRARAGSIRSPLWRHGGSTFGPHPKDFGYSLPKAIRRAALWESLKGKLQDQELVVVTAIEASVPKTKPFAGLAKTFGVERNAIIVLDDLREPVVKSLRNLAVFSLRRADELNAFDVINAKKVLLTRSAFDRVQTRLLGKPLEPLTPTTPAIGKSAGPTTAPRRTAKRGTDATTSARAATPARTRTAKKERTSVKPAASKAKTTKRKTGTRRKDG